MDQEVIMEFDYMMKDTVCSTVKLYRGGRVEVADFTDVIVKRPFGVWGDRATVKDIGDLFEFRCFPRTRANCKELLADIGLEEYNPRSIIAVTHGVMADDLFWIRFANERHLTWEDVSRILKL